MSAHEFKQIIGHIKISHKTQYPVLVNECKKQITNTNLKCYCSHLKQCKFNSELRIMCTQKCSNTCKFCQFSDASLYDCVLNASLHEIKSNFTLSLLVNRYWVLNKILKNNPINLFSLNDIYDILNLDTLGNIVYPSSLVNIILSSDEYSVSNSHDNNKLFYINLIKTLLHSQHTIDNNSNEFNMFAVRTISRILNNHDDIYGNDIGQIINSEQFIFHIINHCSGTLDNVIMWTIDNSPFLWKNLMLSSKLSTTVVQYLIKKNKIEDLMGLLSEIYKNIVATARDTLYLTIQANNIFDSIFMFNPMSKLKELYKYPKIKIIYQSSLNNIGSDVGGLTRDMFTNMNQQLVHYFDQDDMMFCTVTTLPADQEIFKLIGNFLCRSIFGEQIVPSINFHPMVTLSIIKECYTGHHSDYPNYEDIKEFLLSFNIDYLNTIFAIENFTFNEFFEFLELEEDEPLVLKKGQSLKPLLQDYIIKLLFSKYANSNTKLIAKGFSYMLNIVSSQNANLRMPINLTAFHHYIVGERKYDIIGTSTGSLQSSLTIVSEDCVTNISQYNQFKKCFLNVLQKLNLNDKSKLQELFKFWFGTHSLSNFKQFNPTIRIIKMPNFMQCFKSSTCFGSLICNDIAHINSREYTVYIEQTIHATLENQKFCESVGLHMQLM